ncbi:hypothetical protein CK227_10370 [Mesorhizobium sp. WSM4308]|uniref:hypothetical protein n=1 Tax=Mesorhizobium sp. WSM4308 TaxID=2029409 RepID=UPI000BAE97F3|nr:hypothetical protein [Mesorhizobium sp. WSM4308]PBB75187.1 hypothetical protein CK227_10370 [Mesorhizobium sp. WSM4308]
MNMQATVSAVAFAGMERFHEIPDAAAILVTQAGVYRQVKLYRRGDEVYAGQGTGFIRLFRNGGTSTPHTKYAGLDLAGLRADEDRLGRLIIGGGNG